MKMAWRSVRETATFLIIIAALSLFPLANPPLYLYSLMFYILMYVALVESWNIIGGYAGYMSFGHVGFFGIGAYTTALLAIRYGLSPFYTCILGGLIAALFAAAVGYPCLKLRGPYFALVTLCIPYILKTVAMNVKWTGAAVGIWLPLPPHMIRVIMLRLYEAMLVIMAVVVFVARHIERSKMGLGLMAIREDEEVAESMGINTTSLKMKAFVISAFFTGIIGGIYAPYITYVHPATVFNPFVSILIVVMAIFGGRTTWLGPVVGAVVMTLVDQMLTMVLGAETARIAYGACLMVLIALMPEGLVPSLTKYSEWLRKIVRGPGTIS